MATKHKSNCKRVFKNYDMTCPRCIELANGSKPRDGWQKDYYAKKEKEYASFARSLHKHDCKKSGCGPICTAFDW